MALNKKGWPRAGKRWEKRTTTPSDIPPGEAAAQANRDHELFCIERKDGTRFIELSDIPLDAQLVRELYRFLEAEKKGRP